MANPQKEDGHTSINNEDLEALYRSNLSGGELRIILLIIRKTWGWHKKEETIKTSKIVTETKLSRKSVCEIINKLVTKRLLVKEVNNRKNTYKFNKDYKQWNVTKRLQGSYEKVTSMLRKGNAHKVPKETIKRNYKKKLTKVSDYITFKQIWKKVYGKYPVGGRILVDFPIKRLIEAYDLKEVCGAIVWAEQNRKNNQYIPSFNNPLDLERKWNSLINQFNKEGNKNDYIIDLTEI